MQIAPGSLHPLAGQTSYIYTFNMDGSGPCPGNTGQLVHTNIDCVQMATRAQRASVEPSEIAQYELYNSRHGAHFAKTTDVAMEEEDW